MRPFDRPNAIVERTLHFRTVITSTGAGVIANVFNLDPTSYFEFSDMALIFDEYRVVGARIQYFPQRPNEIAASAINGELCCVFDNDDVSAITSYSEALGHGPYRRSTDVLTANRKSYWTTRWKRPTSGQGTAITWYNAQSPTVQGAIKLYADSLTVTTTYGVMQTELVTQFRGSINV